MVRWRNASQVRKEKGGCAEARQVVGWVALISRQYYVCRFPCSAEEKPHKVQASSEMEIQVLAPVQVLVLVS